MKNSLKIGAVAIIITIAIVMIISMGTSPYSGFEPAVPHAPTDKVAIPNVISDFHNATIYAQSINNLRPQVTLVIVKDKTDLIVDQIFTNVTITNELTVIHITYNRPLINGDYTITVVTASGGSFVSRTFTI
jgi:hypothetical protein